MSDGKQVRIDVSRAVPIFADEAMVVARIKSKKNDGKNSVSKEGHIEVLFLDQLSQPPRVISRVAMARATAESLYKNLENNLGKLGVELKSKKMPKQPQKKSEKKSEKNYLG